MARSSKSSALRSLIGVACIGSAIGAAWACDSSLEVKQAPDAGLDPCDPGPHVFCAPVGPEVQGCNTDEGAAQILRRVPRNTRYPLKCVIQAVGPRDENRECNPEAVCKCLDTVPTVVNEEGGATPAGPPAPRWICDPP